MEVQIRREQLETQYGIDLREKILYKALEDKYGKGYERKITIKRLADWSSEDDIDSNLEWGRYLYYNIVSEMQNKEFTMYFSDEPEIIENWFQDEDIRRRINIKTFERDKMFEAISSTKIRNAFLNNDKEYIDKSVPNAVTEEFDTIKQIIDEVYTNPKEE